MMKKCEKYKIRVLGCKVNQYEMGEIELLLKKRGMMSVSDGETADVVIVHGCAVTAVAARKSRQAIRKLRKEHPEALLIMSGCGAAVDDFDSATELCYSVKSGTGWLERLEELIDGICACSTSSIKQSTEFISLSMFNDRTRGVLKIQDGCNIMCSYCIVPHLRGPSRDKALDLLLREAQDMIAKGYREIVLSGVSIGLYGMSSGITLARVVRKLLSLSGLERLRMSSLHPQEVTDELLEVWASSESMMPHVHLPLQSGSDLILRSMCRGYTAELFLSTIGRFKTCLDRPAFTTDIITGFPGETDDDFQQTLYMVEEVGFLKIHVFPYSERPGTPAASMPGKIPADIAKERAEILKKLGHQCALGYTQPFVGSVERVLVEKVNEKGICEGRGEHYFPVRFQGDASVRGQLVEVRVTKAFADYVTGERDR